MENRIETSHGVEVPRKSRSLDLKSLYKARVAKDVGEGNKLKRKAIAGDCNESGERKKKKTVKEVSLSSLKNVSSGSKKSVDRVSNSGLSSGLHGTKDLKSEANQKSNGGGIGIKSISALALNDGVLQIPRRKRGLVGRKKSDGVRVLKQQDEPCGKADVVDQASKLSGDDSGSQVSLKVRVKESFDDFKENRNSESNSSKHAEEEGSQANHLVASNGNSTLKKSRRKQSKTKNLAQDGKVVGTKTEPLVENSTNVSNDSHKDDGKKSRRKRSKTKKLAQDGKAVGNEAERLVDNSTAVCNDSPEDDEENLEENAAMMLSSRFDPSCTGYSTNNKGSALPTVDGLQFLLSTDHDFDSRRSKSLSESESPSVDAAGRVLRPRKQHKERGHSRKRRHFYEVFFRDLDAFWMLNRRIKVFWPLDQIWYYGLVNDYDKERKLHHVKYDDRDEEWINLQSERFKLLLLPSEVPGKSECKRSAQDKSSDQRKRNLKLKTEKEKRGFPIQDDSCVGSSYMDSEPIISWLARSSRRVKSPFRTVKKQKTSDSSTKPVPPPFLRDSAVNFHGHHSSGTVRREKRKVSRNSSLVDRFADDAMKEDSTSESISCSKDSKMPIVYFRRRFRKAGQDFSHRINGDLVRRGTFVPFTSFGTDFDGVDDFKKGDVVLGRLDPGGPLWSVDDTGLLKLILPGLESGKFKFHISLPTLSTLHNLVGMRSLWLGHAAMLLRCGTVMITLPQVHLEMLFVDNVVGLRFLLFEGCLKQALAIIFMVLTTFHQPAEHEKIVELQLPVTSIRFKLTCFQNLGKQLVFAFYNYSEVEALKWMYLDWKLKKHCLLAKQLPLNECTYDNVQMFQNDPVQPSFIKDKQTKSRQEIGFTGVPGSDPPLPLSFTSVPTFYISLHLKLLLDPSLACINFRERDTVENLENSGSKATDDCYGTKESSNKASEVTLEENRKFQLGEVASDGCFSSSRPAKLRTGWPVSSDEVRPNFHEPYLNDDGNVAGTSADFQVPEKFGTDGTVQLQARLVRHSEFDQSVLPSSTEGDKPENGSESFPNGLSVEIPPFNQFEKSVAGVHSAQQPTDLSWSTNGSVFFPSPNPTAPRSTGQRNKHSSSFGYLSHGWSDGKADHIYNSFGNGPKKPRTQVSYSLPSGGFDGGLKQKSIQKGVPPKRIRKASVKRSSDVSRGSQKNLELLACDVNILVTASDRGWRESGAKVVLELFDHNEWRLAVKLSGETKYSYKAHQFLQPGSTNRFTHAMMWKGGKDWILEFFDRSQWALFKELHEECYNRNIRAASMKSIPIPGVRVIDEGDDNGTEIAFVRGSSKYFRQAESDIEMALDPSHVLYDMDSDDEQWILEAQNSSEFHGSGKISDEMFEKTVDMFEKAAYAQQRDQLTSDEIEELMVGVGPMDIIKSIYEYWQQKRQKNGMPLIRHLQPPLWERYQQQLREWELAMTKMNASLCNGYQDKTSPVEKPPMFAFCMKPRGLEVPNKGSKQRSQRKISVSAHSNSAFVDHDGFHTFGRRFNGFSYGDEKFVYLGHNYDSLDDSPLPQTSPRTFSPRDMGGTSMINDGLDRNHFHKLHRSKSRKYGTILSPNDPQGSYGHRMLGNRNWHHRWNTGFSEWLSQRHFQPEVSQRLFIEQQFEGSDLEEFRLRDASGAAQRARTMAKLKRERAQRLVYRADLAIHKAVAAIMTAEASRGSFEGSDGDG